MLYQSGRGVLYRANPVTKLVLLLPALAFLVVAPAWLLAVAGCAVWAAGAGAGIGVSMARRLLLVLLPIGVGLFAVHGVLLPSGTALAVGPLEIYPDGVARASLIFARLFLALAVGLVIVMTTRLADLADALEAKGVPSALSFLMTAPLAMAETVAAEGRALKEALQVRGVGMRGGPLKQLRAMSFIVMPLVRNQLTYAGPRARAGRAWLPLAFPTHAPVRARR
ncbi:energy-coupling factor transporter transmembrane component T family protein [Aquamicrobium segne]|uniref:Energy-coupling factor transporter transmembrane component T family protein n=1 Tax=Aquamicrobium segne TaxID=469547 RepID=A0ABW0GXX5_9HYPH